MKKTVICLCAAVVMAACVTAVKIGGESSAGTDEAGVQAAANFVLASVNANECHGVCAGLGKGGMLTSVEVQSATKQVVAGALYKLELVATNAQNKKVAITASVWDRPWLAAKNDAAEPATQITHISYKYLDGDDA